MTGQKFTCDIVDHPLDPAMTFRGAGKMVEETYFRDLNGYKDRIVRLKTDDFMLDLDSSRTIDMTRALLYGCRMLGWLDVYPDERLLNKFAGMPAAQNHRSIVESMLDRPCGDVAGIESLARQLHETWRNFIVESAQSVFDGDLYHQLLWIENVNAFEDNISEALKPLDIIGPAHIQVYVSQARDRLRAEINGADNIVNMEARRALREGQNIFRQCLDSFNNVSGIRAAPPGLLHAAIRALESKRSLSGPAPPPSAPFL